MKDLGTILLIVFLVSIIVPTTEKTIWTVKTYPAWCTTPSQVSTFCSNGEIEKVLPLLYFKVDYQKQNAIRWGSDEPPISLKNCVIANEKNWSCEDVGGKLESFNMIDGEMLYLTPSAVDYRLVFLTKSEYWLAKMKFLLTID